MNQEVQNFLFSEVCCVEPVFQTDAVRRIAKKRSGDSLFSLEVMIHETSSNVTSNKSDYVGIYVHGGTIPRWHTASRSE